MKKRRSQRIHRGLGTALGAVLLLTFAVSYAAMNEPPHVRRIVLAGDSWAEGMARPLFDTLAAGGFGDVAVTFEGTAISGTTARQWITNDHGMLDGLRRTLDANPRPDLVLVSLGVNDLHREISANGFAAASPGERDRALDAIAADIERFVAHVRRQRPWLHVALMSYDQIYVERLRGRLPLPGMTQDAYTAALLGLERRKGALARRTPGCVYADNFGTLQRRFGPASDPREHMPDGLHPDTAGYVALIENMLAHELRPLLSRRAPSGGAMP